jgi:hypothetical protein
MLCGCVLCAESSRTGTLTTRRQSTLEISQRIAACAMSAKARLGPHSVWDYRRDTTCEILAVLNTVLNTTLCFPRSRIFLATWRKWLKRTHASEANAQYAAVPALRLRVTMHHLVTTLREKITS